MTRNLWPSCPGLPPHAAAVLAALHLSEPRADLLKRLSDRESHDTLAFCDRSQLTLSLHRVAPEFLAAEMDACAEKNLARLQIVESAYRLLSELLPFEFVALKGITQCALSGIRPEDRAQYDIDLYLPRTNAEAACRLLVAQGYEPQEGMEAFPTDHLPALARPTPFEWRGDFFAADLPLAIELHFRFWSPEVERLPAPGIDEFWTRRVQQPIAGVHLGVLAGPDALGYAALHLLKHVLRGNTRPFHVYELARCLRTVAKDDAFWNAWQSLHSAELRKLEAVAFQLAESWFGCDLAPAAREEIERLPAATRAWFAEFAASPATSPFFPNKDELWLHISLLNSTGDRLTVARRRLLPGSLPPTVAPHARGAWRGRVEYLGHLAGRLRHHTISLFTTLAGGARLWWRANRFGTQFWTFLAAAVLFNLSLFVFFLLYNLFLADFGFGAGFLGSMNGAARLGSLAGTIPAAFLAHRLGLRTALLGTIAATAALTLLRAYVVAATPVIVLAFLASAVFAVWAVVMAPAIASVVEAPRRPAAFSFFFAAMFATGIAGNWVGGRLPEWLHGKQQAVIVAAIVCAAALLPALRLHPPPAAAPGTRMYPRGPFLWRFLLPFAIWHLATSSFNPFNNLYLAHLNFSVPEIGSIFSASQLVQVVTVLFAPLVIRRCGLVTGIAWMMGATALSLTALAGEPAAVQAILAYIAYMSCQWMSEPGLNTLLMNNVAEGEREGAASLNYFVAFGAQAVATFAAGHLFERAGYSPVLLGAAAAAGVAAILFKVLLG
jgi:MFS family permease